MTEETQEVAQPESQEEPKVVTSFRDRLSEIVRSTEEYREKNYKKIPATKVIRDNEFLLFTVQVLSTTNMELKERLDELMPKAPGVGQIVGIDGKVITKDEPLLIGTGV
jgi:hypothetical protein